VARLALTWWWLAAAPLALLLYFAGWRLETAALGLAALIALAGVFWQRAAEPCSAFAAGLLLAALLALAGHLLADDFAVRTVWLYSAPALPWYLKLANLWGGDEGTLLLMAALAGVAARRLARFGGWTSAGALILAATLAAGALIWNPFLPTPLEDLAAAASRGMNAHLIRVWMAFHPPLVLAAYVFFLAPAGAALEALWRGRGPWRQLAGSSVRLGWLILSLGLASGMWWAYEDFTFGQIWHWDPVQTSVFMVWALATAHLHALRRYRPDGSFALAHPLLGLMTGGAALFSMAVTRSPMLASSHRYLGETSLPFWLGAAVLLLGLILAGLFLGRRFRPKRQLPKSEGTVWLWGTILLLGASALVAAAFIGQAYASAALGLPRPESLKPFFETLARWARPGEVEELRRAFDRWDIDNFAMNRWLAPLALALGLVGGHNFLPLRRRAARWAITLLVAALALAVALWLQPMAEAFRGRGMTSRQTVAIFPWLDGLLVTTCYLVLAVGLLSARTLLRRRTQGWGIGYFVPLALIHGGIMIALVAGVAATVLDSYAQKVLSYPEDFGRPLRFPDGFSVTVWLGEEAFVDDGGPAMGGAGGFRSVAEVAWQLERAGTVVEQRRGHSVYRDDRPPAAGGQGPVRLMCELVDYRYARYLGGARRMIHPFIHRGLWRDVQVWFPAVEYGPAPEAAGAGALAAARQASKVPVVLKVFPLLSWVWIGLLSALGGAAVLTFQELRAGRRMQRDPRPVTCQETPLGEP